MMLKQFNVLGRVYESQAAQGLFACIFLNCTFRFDDYLSNFDNSNAVSKAFLMGFNGPCNILAG